MTGSEGDGAAVAGGEESPVHVFRSKVWFDELDKVGVLHNSRYAVHVERALADWYASRVELAGLGDGDQLVKAYEIEFRRPVMAVGEVAVELRVAKLGRTSCAYGFRVVGVEGGERVVYAVGTRTVVNVETGADGVMRPVGWGAEFRRVHGDAG